MKSGYKILWTEHALKELDNAFNYVEANFSVKEVKRLAQKVESTIELIARNPKIFSRSDKRDIYKVTILKYNTVYYRIKNDTVEILAFFSNRQSPKKRKM